ncbi:MAG: Nif3-like dinuclear metal center hexameric protein [Halanaeroarchaeum sp.]
MHIEDLAARLDDELRTADFADIDASANGLQVARDDPDVERVAFAVDAAEQTIDAAVDWDADLLVVHHGLSWGGIERLTGRTYQRVAGLVENDVGLYVSHLPLDAHPDLGNAAGLADRLDLANRAPFGDLGPETIGQQGSIPGGATADEVTALLEEDLDHGGAGVQLLDLGPETIESVAIVTGSGADWFDEALADDVDAFLTGEGKGKLYHQARESGVTVFLGGHYATETFGVESLSSLVEEWGPETRVLDAPTGL